MRWPWPFSLFRPRAAGTAAQRAGAWGEQVAADYLDERGYRILGRNVRFGSRCELDLVARSPAPETLVFVEVKTRRTEDFGRPASAVDRAKRRALGFGPGFRFFAEKCEGPGEAHRQNSKESWATGAKLLRWRGQGPWRRRASRCAFVP